MTRRPSLDYGSDHSNHASNEDKNKQKRKEEYEQFQLSKISMAFMFKTHPIISTLTQRERERDGFSISETSKRERYRC